MFWPALTLLVCLLAVSCTHESPPPPVPPPPEDLSTWTVPELVQPFAPEPPTRSGAAVDAKPTAAEKVYPYAPGTPYQVQVPVGWPLDVVLEHGEQVRNIVGGDRSPGDSAPAPKSPAVAPGEAPAPESAGARRWDVREGADGNGETLRSHLFIAASEPGMHTGLVVTTTRRTYYLTCQSVKTSPIRALRWTYPTSTPEPRAKPKEPGILPDPAAPARYHVGYALDIPDPRPAWVPTVFDDGKKTYLIFSAVVLYTEMPLIREVTSQGPVLINVRQFGTVVIVDKMIQRLELRYGTGNHAQILTIVRGPLQTISCPEAAACPVWPAAAPALARRTP